MNWYYMDGDQQRGPVAHDELTMLITAGALKAETPVWRDGMGDWQELRRTELISFLTGSVPPPYEKTSARAPGNQGSSSQASPVWDTSDSNMVCPATPPKSPMHCWWNLLWPGIGNIVLGQVGKGITLMAVSFVANLIFPPVNFVVFPCAIIDAYKVGKLLKAGQPVGKWAFFPK